MKENPGPTFSREGPEAQQADRALPERHPNPISGSPGPSLTISTENIHTVLPSPLSSLGLRLDLIGRLSACRRWTVFLEAQSPPVTVVSFSPLGCLHILPATVKGKSQVLFWRLKEKTCQSQESACCSVNQRAVSQKYAERSCGPGGLTALHCSQLVQISEQITPLSSKHEARKLPQLESESSVIRA